MEKFCRYCGMPLKGRACSCKEAQRFREREAAAMAAKADTKEDADRAAQQLAEEAVDSSDAAEMPDIGKESDEEPAVEKSASDSAEKTEKKTEDKIEKEKEETQREEKEEVKKQAKDSAVGTKAEHVFPPPSRNVSSAQLALRESKQTIISLAQDPINLMKQRHSLSASVCAMLLISLSISIMLCLMTLKSRLSAIVDTALLDVSSRDIFSSAVLTVVLSSGFLFLSLLVISKLFNGTIKAAMLFTTISKASIPYTAYFLLVTAVAFIWPRINDRLILNLMILLLLGVTIYSLYLVEIGTRSQLTNDAVRIVSLSIAYAVSLVLMFKFMKGNLIGSMENMIILRDLFFQ